MPTITTTKRCFVVKNSYLDLVERLNNDAKYIEVSEIIRVNNTVNETRKLYLNKKHIVEVIP